MERGRVSLVYVKIEKMFNFLNLKNNAFGLDISDGSIKVVKLRPKKGAFTPSYFDELYLEKDIIEQGNVLDEEALVRSLKKIVSKARGKLGTRDVVVSLPEEKAFLQVIQMPRMEMSELKTAVNFEAEKYIPMPKDEVYLDFQVVEPIVNSLDHLDLLVSALPKKVVNPYFSALKKADLRPVAFEIESQAVSRAVIENERVDGRVLIIELGASKTRFIVFAGYSLRFISSSMVCGDTFDGAIAKEFNVSLAEAERLKKQNGLNREVIIEFKNGEGRRKEAAGGVFDALVPPLTDLVEQIKKCQDFYLSHSSHEHISSQTGTMDEILLCGGGASLKGLISFLREHFEVPIKKANPWVNILPDSFRKKPKMEEEEALKYTAALGLALRGVRRDKND